MKNRLAILRLGTDAPITGDAVMLAGLVKDGNIIGGPVPGGIITLIHTEASKSDIVRLAREAEAELGDCLPVFVWDIDEDVTNIDQFEVYQEMVKQFNEMTGKSGPTVIHMSIDDVLDKINRSGLESLTDEELSLLKNSN